MDCTDEFSPGGLDRKTTFFRLFSMSFKDFISEAMPRSSNLKVPILTPIS